MVSRTVRNKSCCIHAYTDGKYKLDLYIYVGSSLLALLEYTSGKNSAVTHALIATRIQFRYVTVLCGANLRCTHVCSFPHDSAHPNVLSGSLGRRLRLHGPLHVTTPITYTSTVIFTRSSNITIIIVRP